VSPGREEWGHVDTSVIKPREKWAHVETGVTERRVGPVSWREELAHI